MAALWPERCKGLVSVSGYLIGSQAANKLPLPPAAELAWWYQFYFATERGRAGYERYRREFARLIWQTASPRWTFDDATFERRAAAFDNPDHVSIVIHNYRWRIGLADGGARFDGVRRQLAGGPTIGVPTITLEGDANGAPTRMRRRIGRSSRGGTPIASSPVASGTTCRRKRRAPSPTPCGTSLGPRRRGPGGSPSARGGSGRVPGAGAAGTTRGSRG